MNWDHIKTIVIAILIRDIIVYTIALLFFGALSRLL
jgi:hypothetical protein